MSFDAMAQEDHDPYSSENHTLIPNLYLYRFFNDNVGYVLMEPKTRALIAVDVGEFDKSKKIITELEKRHDTQLKYILSTHHHPDHIGANLQWKEEKKRKGENLEIITGKLGEETIPGHT